MNIKKNISTKTLHKQKLREMRLKKLEQKLKSNIDVGITIWCEPVGDKSKLRNLRGIKFKK